MLRKTNNFSGFFLDPDKGSLGTTVVMASDPKDAKAQILKEAAAICSCEEDEVILLLVQHGEATATFFNSQLEAGNV